ncbi:MAG: twin-arginine translocase TatA/TatE family subunit [Alphaproteobacteria bacterium]|nr:twin-arginine translocase TatA/TatE family subunit [Alphaproteobacteria bacterium]
MSAFNTVLSWLEWGIPVVLAIVLHEIAHGCAAFYFGDTTARDNGRLSLNPLRHVDPVGTVIFPLVLILSRTPFVFGWAKPVPVDFRRLKNPKKDMVWVALAGPAMNFFLAFAAFAVLSVCKNVFQAVLSEGLLNVLLNTIVFNFSVMVFNLIPVLPMDGGRIITGLLPFPWAVRFAKTEKYGFGIIALLLIFLPVLGNYIGRDFDFISRFLAFAVQKMFVFFAGFFGLTQGEEIMSIGFFQLLVILLIILVLFGRGKLPALAEDLGKSVSSFKKGLSEDKAKDPEEKQDDTDPSKDA